MARVSTTAKPNNAAYDVSATAYNAFVADYISQTDTTAQNIASNLAFADGKYPSATGQRPKYTVFKEGANYRVLDCDGTLQYNSTDLPTAVNDEAFAGLTGTRQETVELIGDCTVPASDPILIPSFCTLDLTQAYLTLGAASTKALIENEDQTNGNYRMKIIGGILDGDRANNDQETAKGIYINNNNQNMDARPVELYNIVIWNVYSNAYDIQLSAADELWIHMCTVQSKTGGTDTVRVGMNLKAGDASIWRCGMNSYYENMIVDGGMFDINGCYFGGSNQGGTTLNALYVKSPRNLIRGCIFDSNYKQALKIEGGTSYKNTITGNIFRSNDNLHLTNTYPCIELEETYGNMVTGNMIGKYAPGETDVWSYGIEETSNSGANCIVGNMIYDIGTKGVKLLHADTIADHNFGGVTY